MSCNECRVLRKGCIESCILRLCLQWIDTHEASMIFFSCEVLWDFCGPKPSTCAKRWLRRCSTAAPSGPCQSFSASEGEVTCSFDPSIGWGNGIAIDLSWDLHKVDVGHIQQGTAYTSPSSSAPSHNVVNVFVFTLPQHVVASSPIYLHMTFLVALGDVGRALDVEELYLGLKPRCLY
ncbi:hypothetical protein JHK84_053683 [Glycine max]|nr:hypothetical protein JHK86_053658 [Glycine max]KAG5083645.1 hypothetical protein JHK84_053683 [Glycine max]